MTVTTSNVKGVLGLFVLILLLQSCGLTMPSVRKTNVQSNVTVSDASSQVEPLKYSEYTVLKSTKGTATTNKVYFLFIPLGKTKTDAELYENAYFDAVESCEGADALILPMRKSKKLTIPLLIINYQRKQVTVKGVGVQVKR
ncbi:MAG: hypothetical protein RL660_1718 [Bacteroidota bacterium]|jgi:hypothetical protein